MQGLWIIANALKFSLKPFSVNFKGNVKIFQIHIIRVTYVLKTSECQYMLIFPFP